MVQLTVPEPVQSYNPMTDRIGTAVSKQKKTASQLMAEQLAGGHTNTISNVGKYSEHPLLDIGYTPKEIESREYDNTYYQRMVDDMMKAGLNPALMMYGGGASGGSTISGKTSKTDELEQQKEQKEKDRNMSAIMSIIFAVATIGSALFKKKPPSNYTTNIFN